MSTFTVVLRGGSPWGFRIKGGREFDEAVTVSKINPNSKAYNEGLKEGDTISAVNEQTTHGLNYADVQLLIKNSQEQLLLEVTREEKFPPVHVNGGMPHSSATESQSVNTGNSNSQLNATDSCGTRANPFTSTAPASSPFSTSPSGSSSDMATTYRSAAKDAHWSEQPPHSQASPSPPVWSKRPILPPASPKLMMHHTFKPLPAFKVQPVLSFEAQGRRQSQTQSVPPASNMGRGTGSSSDTKSKGMNLFRRQQEKLAQLGANVQEINVSDSPFGNFEPRQAYSVQSSPGATVPCAPSRSFSVDEGARTVPVIVQTGTGSTATESYRPRRMRSASEHTDSYYVRPSHDSGFSSWQSGPSEQAFVGRNFGVASYATLPAKPSSASQPKPVCLRQGTDKVPVTQPLTVDADQPVNDFDYHIYSTLPTIKPLRSHNRSLPIDLPELEKEAKFRDFSKPLWANTDLPAPAQPSGDDSHSPPSDNAVSSSDSRDTIIARSDDTKLSSSQPSLEARSEPKMIPVRVVHEQSGKASVPEESAESAGENAAKFDSRDQLWGKRVVEGADHSLANLSSEPARTLQEKTSEPQVNGIKSPSITSLIKPGVWMPGTSPLTSGIGEKKREDSAPSPPETSLKNIPCVWKPSGSPGTAKKEFRPVRLSTDFKSSARKSEHQDTEPRPEETYAWQPPRSLDSDDVPRLPTSALTYTPLTTSSYSDSLPAMSTVSQSAADHIKTNGNITNRIPLDAKEDELRLPSTQSPYITLLQKSRENGSLGDKNFVDVGKKPIMVTSEGHLPKGAQYLGQQITVDGDQQHTDTYFVVPTDEKTTVTRTVDRKPVVYEGIGPVDREGVPLAFRKNVEEKSQHNWYKQMYRSLHKTDKKEDQLGINDMIDTIFEKAVRDLEKNTYRPTYKFPDDISDTKSEEDFAPYRPVYQRSTSSKVDESGYRSEPEGRFKDYFRTSRSTSQREPREPRRNYWMPPSARNKIEVYKNQPRSIVDYEPGFSSIAFQEAKTRRPRSYSAHSSRDRKRIGKSSQFNPPIQKPGELSQYSVGGARQTSEPDVRQSGDGADPREAYRRVQSGGEIPPRGLQKAVPDKPREQYLEVTAIRNFISKLELQFLLSQW